MSSFKHTPSDDSFVEVSDTSSQIGANGNGLHLRPLTLTSRTGLEIQLAVPSSPFEAWIAADILREDFQRSLTASPFEPHVLKVQDEEDNVTDSDNDSREAKVALAAKFLGFVASRTSAKSSNHELNVLHYSWIHFNEEILGENNSIHDLIATVDSDMRTPILASYFEAFTRLESIGKVRPALKTPQLFALSAQGKAEVHAIFGGQGNNEVSVFRGNHACWYPLGAVSASHKFWQSKDATKMLSAVAAK
jgi:hypothetical protein